jgi:kynurenine 3-monooxygenase
MASSGRPLAVSIMGGGLGGALMAIYLARRGITVTLYERRPDIRNGVVDHGRSINMTIAERGLASLDVVGLRERVLGITMPLKGRLVHDEQGGGYFQPYGRTPEQVHHSIKRSELNGLLLSAAEALPNVTLRFQKRYLRGGRTDGVFVLRDERTGETEYARADVLIGADGANSALRREMQRGLAADYEVEYLSEAYKELTIPAGPSGTFQLDPQALHVWPRGVCVLIAIPNLDGSFTATFTMPLDAPVSYQSLRTRDQVWQLFEQHFGEVLKVAPDIVDEFMSRPPAQYLTSRTAPWYHNGRIVLLGDACHSVLPFYGQGMNAAFEDCRVLDQCIAMHAHRWDVAFNEYQTQRKPHTDALARLSKENYVELKEKVRSPMFLARRRIDLVLDRWCPSLFATLYSLVTHTTMPYGDAVARCERRKRWLTWTGGEAVLTAASACLAGGAVGRDWLRSRSAGLRPGRAALPLSKEAAAATPQYPARAGGRT